ncbi:hypothetical protein ACJRPK_06240 [Aquimarina sp. 2-A2]|uniref:hypothetical protein n=1 Tax=Aquimarina sp. 2-A2 TaxID=3382644 RepID=UPI00387EEDD6
MAIATPSQILEKLNSIDINELLDRMEDYVRNRFYDKSDQNKTGIQFQDFCQEVLRKACDGTRKWKIDKCSFEKFIFGTLKSDLSYFFKKGTPRPDDDDTEYQEEIEECYIIDVYYNDVSEQGDDDNNFDKIDDQTVINEWINTLREQGADEDEIQVFECWTAGINTPREIKEYCDISIDKVYNIYKRLRRKKIKFRQNWISLGKQ